MPGPEPSILLERFQSLPLASRRQICYCCCRSFVRRGQRCIFKRRGHASLPTQCPTTVARLLKEVDAVAVPPVFPPCSPATPSPPSPSPDTPPAPSLPSPSTCEMSGNEMILAELRKMQLQIADISQKLSTVFNQIAPATIASSTVEPPPPTPPSQPLPHQLPPSTTSKTASGDHEERRTLGLILLSSQVVASMTVEGLQPPDESSAKAAAGGALAGPGVWRAAGPSVAGEKMLATRPLSTSAAGQLH